MKRKDDHVANDYAFFEADLRPPKRRWLGWLVVPLRRVLWRLLQPAWLNEQLLLERLGQEIERLQALVAELVETDSDQTRRLDALEKDFLASTAAGWDATALARRLAAIEDRLIGVDQATAQPRKPDR
jgi:hypothetical protein